ncbi:fimbria/pilus periplasmic chaperone [Pseudomonas sp. B21-040]|uniref:fimbrial biogenesis chaperone n=1 Tax=Pseudomonas sp. B21-040 TaxID=2895486 RepID=UPI00215E809B|nr:fimbria/pilus periplasmic chaperone [Pseudomonas sp. B21-040]UVL43186.1 fimbria/pilus periplasmic chaperone [Pseudomonas sp. B21-040]
MKSFIFSQCLLSGLILAGSLFVSQAQAAIVINGTRVIYPSDQKEISVKLDNNGEAPLLVQSWIDEGDAHSTPDNSKAPFVLTPPIARIDKHEGQTLRVRFTGQKSLAQDRESIFWLNVLEVPPSTDDGQNKLKIAFRSRVKFFYRPTALKLDTLQIAQQMQWRLVRNADSWGLDATNPTPYYLNLSAVKVGSASAELDLTNSIFAPGEHKTLPLKGTTDAPGVKQVEFSAINDYGGIQTLIQPLTQ